MRSNGTLFRIFDHVTVGIQLKGSEAHAHTLSFSLLDNKPWERRREGEENVNFLAAAREEQRENEDEEEEEEAVEEEEEGRRKRRKINPFKFFESMRILGMTSNKQ